VAALEDLVGQWLKELTVDDLPESCRELAEVLGIEGLVKLVCAFGGTSVYIPKAATLIREMRDERIAREFDGSNLHEIALKYNLSQGHIYRIVDEQRRKARRSQLSLF